MGNLPEMAKRIKALRGTENQVAFAKRLGVSQPTVSAWESGEDTPTPLSCLLLGVLASGSEREWFFKSVGPDLQTVMAAADAILKGRTGAPAEGEILRIPYILETAQGSKDTGSVEPFSPKRVPNPLSTVCVQIDETIAHPMLASGDVIVLDISQNNAANLGPFWNKIILVDIGHRRWPSPSAPGGFHVVGFDRPALCVGQLRLGGVGGTPVQLLSTRSLRSAILAVFSDTEIEHGLFEINIGVWRRPGMELHHPLMTRKDLPPDAEVDEEARREMRLADGCRILGIVIGWFPSPSKSGE
jgi:transcriptional regulator with XRE-family HTH domain